MIIHIADIAPQGVEFNETLSEKWLADSLGEDFATAGKGASVSVRVEPMNGQFLVRGTITSEVSFTCGRCIEEGHLPISVDFHQIITPRPESESLEIEDIELSGDDLEFGYIDGEEINLFEIIREHLILALPMHPVCSEGCKGLCSKCGHNLNESECGCDRQGIDSRWEALKNLKL